MNYAVLYFSALFYVISLQFSQCQKTVSIFKVCNRDELDVDDCLKDSIQAALISMAKGVPELDLKSMDPYLDKQTIIEYKRNQISGKAVMKNVKAYGLGDSKVLAVRSNIQDEKFEIEVDLSCKRIFVEGFVKGEGRLNFLVLRSKGFFNNTMDDVFWTWKLTGKPEIVDGVTYMKIVKFFMRPEVGSMKVHLPSISNSTQLNRLAHEFANTYWRPVYQELLPLIEANWDKIGTAHSNKIFMKIPYNQLFPTSS